MEGLIKIGEFARRGGTNLRTLRYYQELGLLTPAARSEGGLRYYRPGDLNRLRLIRALQDLGRPLERVRDLLSTGAPARGDGELVDRIREALREQDAVFQERMAALRGQRRGIRDALRKLAECEACQHRPQPDGEHCDPCSQTGDPLPAMLSALL